MNDALARAKAREPKQRFRTVKRGPYGGAVGYIGYNGDIDTARSIVERIRKIWRLSIWCKKDIDFGSKIFIAGKEKSIW